MNRRDSITIGDNVIKLNDVVRVRHPKLLGYWKFKYYNIPDDSVTVFGPCNKLGTPSSSGATFRTFKLERIVL